MQRRLKRVSGHHCSMGDGERKKEAGKKKGQEKRTTMRRRNSRGMRDDVVMATRRGSAFMLASNGMDRGYVDIVEEDEVGQLQAGNQPHEALPGAVEARRGMHIHRPKH